MRHFRPCFLSRWLYPGALFRIRTSEKILCLTFDDGPDPGSTPELLDILDTLNVRAVFFCSGQAAKKYPELVNEIKLRGHIVGNHCYSHPDGWKTPVKKYCENTGLASQFTSGTIFRPPYGRIRLRQYWYLKKSFRIIFWDIMSYDYDRSFGAERSLHLLNRKIRPGSIIVLHDTPDSACKIILLEFIKNSISKGYRFEVFV
jgi:peptidoglycan/xylan/chitin deacetylase (PgdA/CDA1 family)